MIGRQKTKQGMETNRWRYKSKYFFISDLNKDARISSAWYFDGSVYGQHIKFDIFDEIGQKIKAKWFTEFDIRPDRF